MKNIYCLVLAFFLCCLNYTLIAQNENDSIDIRVQNELSESYILRQNLWLNSINASGLSVTPVSDYGYLNFAGNYTESDYKTTYDPSNKIEYGMNAYGFKSLDKLFLKGGFSYYRTDENNVEWTMMMDPLRDNPFIIADSIGGDWKKDYYKLNMLMATSPVLNILRFGVGIDYNVSTGGRDNDPRPKAIIKDLSLRPSLIIDLNKKNNLGFTYLYEDYRQDISVMNKYGVGGSVLYKIMGLALKEKPIVKSSIEYRNDRLNNGLAMQYGHQAEKLNIITELKYNLLSEKGVMSPYKSMLDKETGELNAIPEEDFKFSEKEYSFLTAINYKGNTKFHYFKIQAEYGDGALFNLTTEQVELKTNKLCLDAKYEMFLGIENTNNVSKFIINVNYKNTETENLFYALQTIERIDIATGYEKPFILFNNKFSFNVLVKYSQNLNSELNIDPKSEFFEFETDITNPFVVNNYNYATSNYLLGNIGLTYYHTLKSKTNLYIGCKAGRLQVIESSYFENEGNTSVALNIGILF
ncbi:MAG: hypothetical protein GQ564_23535 [Bacteroidales bacterium]|nr:hypothetical protein [Bacteroidales bacterium]